MQKPLDFTGWEYIQADIETHDPVLLSHGYSCYRGQGFILGCAISGPPGTPSEYYNLGHPGVTKAEQEANKEYLRKVLGSDRPKLGARIKYDVHWLEHEGIPVKGLLYDVQLAEPLLDEYARSYSLDSLAKKYNVGTKQIDVVYKWLLAHGFKPKDELDSRRFLKDVPYDICRPYALGDVDLPGRIFEEQRKQLVKEELWDLFIMETQLQRATIRAERTGFRINEKGLEEAGNKLLDALDKITTQIETKFWSGANPSSPKDSVKMLEHLGLEPGRNPPTALMRAKAEQAGVEAVGNPSVDKYILKQHASNPDVQAMIDYRHYKQLLSLYIKPWSEFAHNGRIYAQYNQLNSDEGGTVSGRYSARMPNPQQVSKAEEDEGKADYVEEAGLAGKIIRALVLPDEGYEWVLSQDGSQIEYRIMGHYARGIGADAIRKKYNDDPNTDYHKEAQALTGITDRREVKKLNFGIPYGMGPGKMAKQNGWTLSHSQALHNAYHERVPFVRTTMNIVGDVAKDRGFIRTILGRKARLLWAHVTEKNGEKFYQVSKIKTPYFNEAYKTYVFLNRLIQGTAADWMKKAMVDAELAGVFDVLPLHITLHDELDNSMNNSKICWDAARELNHIMASAIKLQVPIIVNAEAGPTWGNLTKVDLKNEVFVQED